MRHLLTPLGLCSLFVLVAGNVWGQTNPPTVKPAANVVPRTFQLATDAEAPRLFFEDPCFFAVQRYSCGPNWGYGPNCGYGYGSSYGYGPNCGVACGPTYGSPYYGAYTAIGPATIVRGACCPKYEERIDSLVARAPKMGNVGVDTAKADAVPDRRIPEPLGNSPGVARKNNDVKIQLASFEPQVVAQNGKENPPASPELKQLTDGINQAIKAQADLIRSLDLGGIRPGIQPGTSIVPVGGVVPVGVPPVGVAPVPYGPAGCVNGNCPVDSCAMILTGRTGLELTRMVPQVHDVLNLPRTQGLFIKEVFAKSPAEAAGYKRNDILIEMDGKKVPAGYFDFLAQVFQYVKNDVPINAVVLRAGQRVEITGMKITDRRVVPPLPNECPLDTVIPQLNQIAPGINTSQVSRAREMRTVTRPNGVTDIIWVDR